MDVISLEKNKVVIKEKEVIKKSSIDELKNMMEAKKKIDECNITINKDIYNVKIPEIYDFVDNKIVMERCIGENVEILLRNSKTHDIGVDYTNQILNEFIKKKFFWKDYAPRNILIHNNSISIMDFERGIEPENVDLLNYFLDSVYEEYSSFLLPEERLFKIDEIYKYNVNSILSMSSINSKRVRTILKKLGYDDIFPFEAYLLAVKMILINEEPYLKNNEIIYPLIELEDYILKEGHDKYADRIIGGYNEKVRGL